VIIAIANQKGGAGKTTVAISLATEWHRRGYGVLLVDGDPQGSAQTWAAVAADSEEDVPTVVGMDDGRTITRQVPKMAKDYDIVVIDTPPRIGSIQRAAFIVSDLAIVPASAGGLEAWALAETLDVVSEAQAIRTDLIVKMILNRMNQSRLSAAARDSLAEETGLPVFEASFGQRVAFAEALTAGSGPTLYDPNSVAASEVYALADEIEQEANV